MTRRIPDRNNRVLNDEYTLSQTDINKLRHSKERLIYLIYAVINTLIIGLIIYGLSLLLSYGEFMLQAQNGSFYTAGAALVVASFVGMGFTFTGSKVQAVKVTKSQFPELHDILIRYTKRLGLRKVPELYVKQDNGVLNAFASYFWGRNYILLNTELFELAFLEHKDMDAVAFILAHEMAHIRLHHTRFWYNLSVFFIRMLPIVGPLLSRASEFSCDRIAAKICPEGIHGIFTLLLGRHLYANVNLDEYLRQARETKGIFERLINLTSSHPVNSRRVTALYDDTIEGRIV